MKKHSVVLVMIAMLAALCIPAAFAQATGTVKGVAKDMQGNPIAGATVEWYNTDNGRKYTLKTNKKGEYFSLGIEPGKYKVTLLQDGKQLDSVNGYSVKVDENTLDFDEKQSQAEAAKQKGINQEQLKQMQEAQEKQAKEVTTVKSLNEKLQAANQSIQAQDFDSAINTLNQATQVDASRDLLWARLGDAYVGSAPKQTDPAEKTRRYTEAVSDYQKAVDIKQKAVDAEPQKKPDDLRALASYYNNLAQAESKIGKVEEAVKAYDQAAQLYPAGAAQFYYNQGAVLTNAGKADQAIASFDKAIAADPNKAEAYYQKGVNLIAKETTDKNGKVIPAPGTEEALNKYLELQPNGPFAEAAKGLLQSIGATVETSYGKKKPSKK